MKVAIVGVCYNTYDQLRRYADSLRAAHDAASDVEFAFVVADTSASVPDADALHAISEVLPTWRYQKVPNVGYFPAFKLGFDLLERPLSYDYVCVSNVDLRVDRTFFAKLRDVERSPNQSIGILAPSILSRERGTDANPKTLYRPTRLKLQRNVFIFRHTWLLRIYMRLAQLKARVPIPVPHGTTFYSPHGSFIIFTREYLERGASVDYPRFLFGEEDFVAEECRRNGMKVRYQRDLVVYDDDHGSTSNEKLEFLAGHHADSLEYIIARYHS